MRSRLGGYRLLQFFLIILGLTAFASAESLPPPDAATPDAGRYYGPIVGGQFHGIGRFERSNGDRYEGEFANGLFSGKGRLQFGSGEIYEGELHDGMMSGQGRLQLQDGSVYVGAFRNNAFNGIGHYEMADGALYDGAFENGQMQGSGRLRSDEGEYSGEFRLSRYWGHGEMVFADGAKYRGEFVMGRMHGRGSYEDARGDVYEGDFDKGEFTGHGTYSRKGGAHHEGGFLKWVPHGEGRFTDGDGNVYEGNFVNGQLEGLGRYVGADGTRYEGEFKFWRFDGQGELRMASGDTYKGHFAAGLYDGEGTLTYAKARPDGRTQDSGTWRYGTLFDENARRQTSLNVETALYHQVQLLDAALASLAPRDPAAINLYMLSVAGDGSQEVFRREVEFVRDQFARRFGTDGHAIALINSRNTVDVAPMATVTSIRRALHAIAARMDKDRDILFVFLSSHGSKDHELVLNQNGMSLRGLHAQELAELLRETGIRWKAVVVSACYSGGFIDPLRDEHTLVITAARHDRRSFGCSDESEFTYFGEAFFKEALPRSSSFQDAFARAEQLVRARESADRKDADAADPDDLSLPQIYSPEPMEQQLRQWWNQTQERIGAR